MKLIKVGWVKEFLVAGDAVIARYVKSCGVYYAYRGNTQLTTKPAKKESTIKRRIEKHYGAFKAQEAMKRNR